LVFFNFRGELVVVVQRVKVVGEGFDVVYPQFCERTDKSINTIFVL
jgi:hypothetical protein